MATTTKRTRFSRRLPDHVTDELCNVLAEDKVFGFNDLFERVFDNLKVRKAGKVQAWVKSHAHEIELFYLPSYAPDHDPSEYLNNDLKQQLRQQPQSGSEQELVERTRSVLRAIQRSPKRVRAYFRPEPVRYAA